MQMMFGLTAVGTEDELAEFIRRMQDNKTLSVDGLIEYLQKAVDDTLQESQTSH